MRGHAKLCIHGKLCLLDVFIHQSGKHGGHCSFFCYPVLGMLVTPKNKIDFGKVCIQHMDLSLQLSTLMESMSATGTW